MGTLCDTCRKANVPFGDPSCNCKDCRLVRAENWIATACAALQRGVQIMSDDQLLQWEGVRAVMETAPIDCKKCGNRCAKPEVTCSHPNT